jgi:signal transduction histidine kinase
VADNQTLSVIMVDDEEALCLGVKRIVDRYSFHLPDVQIDVGYEFAHFQSGEDFLAALADGAEPDLLLLDLKLPGIDGLDVLQQVSDQGREALTLFITAYATFETAVKATKLGAYDFLPKPFSPDELRYGLRKASTQLILSRQARALADERRQIRFNFISVLAHELKSPLNAVQGYLNILLDDVPGDDRRMIERSLLRLDGMKKLIFDLLDLTRIESGQKQRVFTDVDLRALAAASIDLLQGEAGERGIVVALDCPEGLTLHADAGEIEIVLNNLVSNAVKYTREGGTVTVRVATDEQRKVVLCEVSDNGLGIPAEDLPRIFDKFYRVQANSKIAKGTGLGLTLVKHIVETVHEGKITVTSEVGKGSTFGFELPLIN